MAKQFTEADFSEETLAGYADGYSEKNLWDKVTNNVKSIGKELIYKAFQLFYVAQNPKCPQRIKVGIFGALTYLPIPLDLLPDFAPVLGYTDDAAVIAAAIALAQFYIDDDVKYKAKSKMADLLGEEFTRGLD